MLCYVILYYIILYIILYYIILYYIILYYIILYYIILYYNILYYIILYYIIYPVNGGFFFQLGCCGYSNSTEYGSSIPGSCYQEGILTNVCIIMRIDCSMLCSPFLQQNNTRVISRQFLLSKEIKFLSLRLLHLIIKTASQANVTNFIVLKTIKYGQER